MRNYLTIAGTDSRDFGVYISGQGTFSAPEKAYEFYSVPGRNGAILGNDNRLENIEVSYNCFIYSNFKQNIADFRTFLLSLNGYQRLTDSYHPDEYRMAVYTGPFEPEVTEKNDAGSFVLTFNCKPQRYLYSGETVYSFVQGSPQYIDGENVYAYGTKLDPTYFEAIVEVKSRINGSPGSPRTLTALQTEVITANGETVTQADLSGKKASKARIDFGTSTAKILAKTDLALPTSGWTFVFSRMEYPPYAVYKTSMAALSYSDIFACSHLPFVTADSYLDMLDQLNSKRYLAGMCCYGGDIYIATDPITHPDETSFNAYMASLNAVVDGLLRTPVSVTAPATAIRFPIGWITFNSMYKLEYVRARYGVSSDMMSNPTEFAASPLIRTFGAGSFTMDGVTVTIANCDSYVDIDCDLMDCYEGSINRNKDVTFSTYDFPKLQPGDNQVTVNSGITLLQMTPRWWRV